MITPPETMLLEQPDTGTVFAARLVDSPDDCVGCAWYDAPDPQPVCAACVEHAYRIVDTAWLRSIAAAAGELVAAIDAITAASAAAAVARS